MKGCLLKARRFLLIVSIVMVGGCTTSVGNVKKMDGYDKKISSVAVYWHNPVSLRTTIKKSGQGVTRISQEEHAASKKGIEVLVSLFSEYGANRVAEKLASNSVSIAAGPDAVLQKINLSVREARTDCAPLGCTHNLWILANVFDVELKRTVWTGYFKVGKPFARESDEKVIDDFVESLIDELKDSRLI